MLPRTIADSRHIFVRFFEGLVGKGRGRDPRKKRKGRSREAGLYKRIQWAEERRTVALT